MSSYRHSRVGNLIILWSLEKAAGTFSQNGRSGRCFLADAVGFLRILGMGFTAVLLMAACEDSRWSPGDELPKELQEFFLAAERCGGLGGTTYVYPAREYDRIKSHLESTLRADFKAVTTAAYNSHQYDITTETIEFEKKTRHKKKCIAITEKYAGRVSFASVKVRCEVLSYWTRWNKPPTHSPGDFLAWQNDWYYDKPAMLIESIKVQEALREKLGYSFLQVLRIGDMLLDDKIIETTLLQSGLPWK